MANEEIIKVTIEMTEDEVISRLKGIRQNIDRGIRLIELHAPAALLENEIRMIQRRALIALSYYEEMLELKVEKFLDEEIKQAKD